MNKHKNMPFTDAKTLANYIIYYYEKNMNSEDKLSDIVLQKSLYFLFAYWGGFIRQGHLDKNKEIMNQPEYLYDDRIEAWAYGPVLPSIYKLRKKDLLAKNDDKINELFDVNPFMKKIVDGLLNDILKTDPFRLVAISHMDKCWRDNYFAEDEKHNREIIKEEILEEYGNRAKI